MKGVKSTLAKAFMCIMIMAYAATNNNQAPSLLPLVSAVSLNQTGGIDKSHKDHKDQEVRNK